MKQVQSRQTRHRTYRERGQVLVEFTLVATVFFLFLFGIFDFARMFQSWITVQHSAREAARYAITGLAACDGIADDRTACVEQVAKEQTHGLPNGGIGSTIVSVTVDHWEYHLAYADPATAGPGGPCDTIEVEVVYQHSFITPLVKPIMALAGADPISLKGIQRMTNEPWGNCDSVTVVSPPPPGGGGGGGPEPPGSPV